MTHTNHTPGPLRYTDDFICIYDEQGRCLAEMGSDAAPEVGLEETLANARLFAAAPALLDTLRYVLLADRFDGALTMGTASLSPAIRGKIERAVASAVEEEETTFLQPTEEIIG